MVEQTHVATYRCFHYFFRNQGNIIPNAVVKRSLSFAHIESVALTKHYIDHSKQLACCHKFGFVQTPIGKGNAICSMNILTIIAFMTWPSAPGIIRNAYLGGIVTMYKTVTERSRSPKGNLRVLVKIF